MSRKASERASIGATREGFTVLEVVLAMFVLLIGMTSLLGLFSFGASLARTAELRAGSARAIDSICADLEESLFPWVEVDGSEVAGEPVAIEGRPVPGHPGLTYSARATPDPEELARRGGPLEYRVDVEIAWTTRGSRRAKSFTTLLLREVPFGQRMRQRFVLGRKPAPLAEPSTGETRP
jgi:hypothetical protein